MCFDEKAWEGPMGEYSGYLKSDNRNHKALMKVTAITHRNNAILPVVVSGYPAEENHTVWSLGLSARFLLSCAKHNFPSAKRGCRSRARATGWL